MRLQNRIKALVFPRIATHGRAAGDPLGPFDVGGRQLRIVVDLPREQRRIEEWNQNTNAPLDIPDPVRFLWSLTSREDIDLYWIGDDEDPADAGRIVIPPGPPGPDDFLGFSIVEAPQRTAGRAIWPYSTYKTFADEDAASMGLSSNQWLEEILIAQASVAMGADLMVTTRQKTLSSSATYITDANARSAAQAIGVVGLYLRSRKKYPIVGPEQLMLHERSSFALAVEELLPSWRVWAAALSQHTFATGNDGPKMLAQSVKERIIRMLRCRDQLLIASLSAQTNTTSDRIAESLDYFLVNLVGAFDAAARAAHIAEGRPRKGQINAGWQKTKWLQSLNNDDLKTLFEPDGTADVLFWICRILRNTVHGEGLSAISFRESSVVKPKTLVQLPHDDADELVDRFDLLGGNEVWGLHRFRAPIGDYIDAGTFIERLLPLTMAVLDDALKKTCTSTLVGVKQAQMDVGPPDSAFDSRGTRARVRLLIGLE